MKSKSCQIEELHHDSGVMIRSDHIFAGDSDFKCKRTNVGVDRKILVQKEKINLQMEGVVKKQSKDRTMLLVLKKTGKAKLFEMPVCHLKPVAKEGRKNTAMNIVDFNTDLSVLSRQFGSKKAQRSTAMASIKIETSLRQDESIACAKLNLSAIQTASSSDQSFTAVLPPCNRKASKHDEVYDLSSIITQEELNSCEDTAKFLLESPMAESHKAESPFLSDYLPLLGDEPSLESVKILLYANSILNFINMQVKDLRKKTSAMQVIAPFSALFFNKIYQNFTDKNGTRPGSMKDKAICYFLVLLLFISDFQIDTDKVNPHLKSVGVRKLQLLIRLVGLKKSATHKNKFQLKLPLPSLPTAKTKMNS